MLVSHHPSASNRKLNHSNPIILLWLGGFLVLFSPLDAEVVVDPPATITHHVQIQPIRVKNDQGIPATTLGTPEESAYILDQVNRIWAQLGVRIDWLAFNDYTSDFAYDGDGDYSVNPRPSGDLGLIVNNAGVPPKNANAIVINMFFVEIVPFFPHLDDTFANGYAALDGNGIAMHIGAELAGFGEQGLDVIASVLAHEIGHNLGLDHLPDSENNLMSSPGPTDQYLTAAQKTTIFNNRAGVDGYEFLQVVPPPTNYSQWAATNALEGGPEGDDDSDKIANVIEFMLGLNPNVSSTLPVPVNGPSGLTWTFTKNAAATADGLIYHVQAGPNLSTWLPAGTTGTGSTVVTDDPTTLVVRLNSGGVRRFMRLNIDSTPVGGGSSAQFIPTGTDTAPLTFPDSGYGRSFTPPLGQ